MLTIIRNILTCIRYLALMSGMLPVIIGAAPHPNSGWGKGRRLFANGTSDRNGPSWLQPSSASTSIKRKRVKKSKTTAPSQSPSPAQPPPRRTSRRSGKIGNLDPLDDDTSSLSELDDEYQFAEDADDNEAPVAPHPTKSIPVSAKTTTKPIKPTKKQKPVVSSSVPAAAASSSAPSVAVAIPLPPFSPATAVAIPLSSVEKTSKEKTGKRDIQQDDKQRLEEHMQQMEAVATAMFITGAPPAKKLRNNATSESTGIIPPSRPPSAPAASSLVPAAAVTIPFRSPSVPKVMPSTITVTTAQVAPVARVALVHVPPAAESAPPLPRSALAPSISLVAPPTMRQPLAPLAPIPEAADMFAGPPYYGRGPRGGPQQYRRPYVARGHSQGPDVEMFDEGAQAESLVGPGMASHQFRRYDPRFGGYNEFGYDEHGPPGYANEHGYASDMFPRGAYAPPYYGAYQSEGWHGQAVGQAVYPWDGDDENAVEGAEARGNTFHPRYHPPRFPSRPPPHAYPQPYGGPRAGPSRLPSGPPLVLDDQNRALKVAERDEDGLQM